MSLTIGIAGITGRVGCLLIEEVAAHGATLSGGTRGRPGNGHEIGGPVIFPDIATLSGASDVVIDFTRAEAVQAHAEGLMAAGRPWVLGTSGLSAEDEAAVRRAAARIPVVYAANFAPGVVIALAFAERLAAALPLARFDAEIVEMHHRQKVDAPSGTAIALGRAVAKGRGQVFEEVMRSGRNGHVGPRPEGEIGLAALRGGQVVGEHSLLFAGADEHIVLTHRAFDRRAFATGAVHAAQWLAGKPPGLYTMRDVLDLG